MHFREKMENLKIKLHDINVHDDCSFCSKQACSEMDQCLSIEKIDYHLSG